MDIDFKEQVLPRLILAVAFIPVFLLVWWFMKMMNEPTPQEIWQQRADLLTVISSDSEILSAISGEPRPYLIRNYKFDYGTTVKDTVFDLLKGDYMAIDIHQQNFTVSGYGKNRIKKWDDKPLCTVKGKFAFNDTVEIRNVDSLDFMFSSKKYWQNLMPENVNSEKLGHVLQKMYYYPDRNMIFDSIGNDFEELIEMAEEMAEEKHVRQNRPNKNLSPRFTFSFMQKYDKATFAVILGDGKADFNVFDDCGNFMLVDCDNISQCSDYESNYNFGVIIGFIIGGLMALCVIIFAPQILNKD